MKGANFRWFRTITTTRYIKFLLQSCLNTEKQNNEDVQQIDSDEAQILFERKYWTCSLLTHSFLEFRS